MPKRTAVRVGRSVAHRYPDRITAFEAGLHGHSYGEHRAHGFDAERGISFHVGDVVRLRVGDTRVIPPLRPLFRVKKLAVILFFDITPTGAFARLRFTKDNGRKLYCSVPVWLLIKVRGIPKNGVDIKGHVKRR